MESTARKAVRTVFRGACIIATALLTCYCVREYYLDQDVTHIMYKKYHEEPDDLYPSITLCFVEPFIANKLSKYSENLTIESYKNFLSGYDNGEWNLSLSTIDYDDVSINLLDYLGNLNINLLNNDNLIWNIINNTYHFEGDENSKYGMVRPPEIYVSTRWNSRKCYTINIPFVKNKRIWSVNLEINQSIFQDRIRRIKKSFYIIMHYPFQLMRSYLRSQVNWESDIGTNDCLDLKVRVGSMDALKRRNKKQDECNDNLKDHDKIMLSRMLEYVGCVPSYWKVQSAEPNCTTREQYFKTYWFLQDFEEELPPCQSIERLITTPSAENCNRTDMNLRLSFFFPDPVYKEINVLRAYGFQSLVGNAGKFILSVSNACLLCID